MLREDRFHQTKAAVLAAVEDADFLGLGVEEDVEPPVRRLPQRQDRENQRPPPPQGRRLWSDGTGLRVTSRSCCRRREIWRMMGKRHRRQILRKPYFRLLTGFHRCLEYG